MSGPVDADPAVPGPDVTGTTDGERRALAAVAATGVAHRVVRHARVGSLAEAAAARGVPPAAVVKTLVVRRGEQDVVLVLVPGDRQIDWPRLRAALQVNRLSMPSADAAREATGYERGTITPLGTPRPWPVVADTRVAGEISLGAGGHGVAVVLDAADLLAALRREREVLVADVTADPRR